MGWIDKQVSMIRDREDFDNWDAHKLVSQLQDNLVKIKMVGFGFSDLGKAFEAYLDMVDMVSLCDFTSSQHMVRQVVPVSYHIHFDQLEFENSLTK